MELFPKNKIIVGLVGLPGRGKTFIARKIARYTDWLGLNSQVFNICQYRRNLHSGKQFTAKFFDPENVDNAKLNTECATSALKDLIHFLKEGGNVAIYDGTNETLEKRQAVKKLLDESLDSYSLIWVESVCNDEKIVEENIRTTQESCPDYKDMDSSLAIQDYKERIEYHRKNYQELSKETDGFDTPFIKLFDFGNQVLVNNVSGYFESKIISLLMHIQHKPCPMYFSRHGESMCNVEDIIGGDPDLSENGYAYSKKLNEFFQGEMKQRNINKKTKIYTSTLQRTIITAKAVQVGIKPHALKILDEINAGSFDGLSYGEISEKYPEDANERKKDKLRYRYPNGESYLDVCSRIEPIIFEIEKSKEPIVIIAHQAVLRCLYAYFCKNNVEDIPHLSIPLHTVIKLIPANYHIDEYRYPLERAKSAVYERRSI